PTDATTNPQQAQSGALLLEEVANVLGQSPVVVRIMILDACRDNGLKAATGTPSPRTRDPQARVGLGGVRGHHRRHDQCFEFVYELLSGKGLLSVDAMKWPNTIVVFSTAASQVASDGAIAAKHSPFAKALINNIDQPGANLAAMLQNVFAEAYQTTSGEQLPFLSTSLIEASGENSLFGHVRKNAWIRLICSGRSFGDIAIPFQSDSAVFVET